MCTDQFPAQLSQAKGWTVHSEVHKLINSIFNKEEMPQQWKIAVWL